MISSQLVHGDVGPSIVRRAHSVNDQARKTFNLFLSVAEGALLRGASVASRLKLLFSSVISD